MSGMAWGGVLAVLVWLGGAASAQEEDAEAAAGKYKELSIPAALDIRGKPKAELPDTYKMRTELKALVTRVLSGDEPLQPNLAKFEGYYLQYLFPQMTWTKLIESPDDFNLLYRARQAFLNDLRRAAPPVHDHMLGMAFEKLKEIASGNFHPAARINAMLIIAELNQKELVRIGAVTPAEPYLPALPFMVDALADKNQIDGVRVVSMLGILRHIQWDSRVREIQRQGAKQSQTKIVEDALRDRINQFALDTINAAEPPAGRTVEGHAWMQRRAIDILGALGTIGTNVNAAATIENMVSDAKAPISLRCGAAEALGSINLPPETKLNPTETAGKLGDLAVTACRNELKRIDDEKKYLAEGSQQSAGGPGGGMSGLMPGMGGPGTGAMAGAGGDGAMMPGMMPGMGGRGGPGGLTKKKDVDAYKLEIAQRRLKSQLHSVKVGLAGIKDKTTGVLGLAKAGSKEHDTIAKLAKVVTDLRDLTDSEEIDDLEQLVSEVRKRIGELETATKSTVALAKPAPAASPKAKAGDPDDLDEPAAPPAKPAAKGAAKPDDAPDDAPAAAPAKKPAADDGT